MTSDGLRMLRSTVPLHRVWVAWMAKDGLAVVRRSFQSWRVPLVMAVAVPCRVSSYVV